MKKLRKLKSLEFSADLELKKLQTKQVMNKIRLVIMSII
jgi:hypothetical protein